MSPIRISSKEYALECRPLRVSQLIADRLIECLDLDELPYPDSLKIKAAFNHIEQTLGWFTAAETDSPRAQTRIGRPQLAMRKEFIKRALAIFHRYRDRPADEWKIGGIQLPPTSVKGLDISVPLNDGVIRSYRHEQKWHRPADKTLNREGEAVRHKKGAMSALSDLEAREREFVQILLREAGIGIKSEALRKALKEIPRHPKDWNRRRAAIQVKSREHRQKNHQTWTFPEF